MTQQSGYGDAHLCTAEFPGDDLHAGQLCDLEVGHEGDHVAVVGLAAAFRRRLTWTAEETTS
ncbi:hypothetical protein [Streptomyces sp. sk2.1]|uniref:hypothetical protein n=1 Tax=Streptomyces sp. sk2.1 TaxID=2478959 RepID=UPI0011E7DA09|nr:hypothetical protein [Streptomyces sp. sk2.1]TXS68893.1 hypothetical protein EAO76_26365 [Streptomyces sp. sk2.1]